MNASSSSSSASAGRTKGGHSSQEPRAAGGDGEDATAAIKSRSKWPNALPPAAAAAGGDESSCCPYIVSAVCDDDASRIHWALHEATARTVFHPRIFWKTSAPAPQNQQQQKPTAPLALDFFTKYFPENVIKAILGGDNPDIPTAALTTSNSNNKALLVQKLLPYWPLQRIPIIFIYVIATNDATFDSFQHLTSRLPVRLIRLQETDFFNTHPNSSSNGSSTMMMSVDRLAALAAAQCIYGGPALVIHGGDTEMSFAATAINEKDEDIDETTTTTSAISTQESSSLLSSSSFSDHDALCHSVRVRGGGIGPGFASKFFVLQSYAGGHMPSVGFEEFQQYLAKFKTQQQQQQHQPKGDGGGETITAAAAASAAPPRILDAHSTKEEIMGHVVQETTSHLRSVIATWAKQALASPTFQRQKQQANDKAAHGEWEKVATCNRLLYVCITGGREGQLLMDLLSSSSSSSENNKGSSCVAGAGAGISYLHPDTVLPELPCKVNFVLNEFLVHHGISHLLLMHHERREQQQRLVASHPLAAASAAGISSTSSSDDDNLRTMALGQRVVAQKKQQVLGRLVIVRGTVVSVEKRNLPVSCSTTINKSHGVDDGNVYHIMYDDGQKDEMSGEELYDALVLYHAEGEKKKRRSAAGVNEALEKIRNAKRAAAKVVSKLLEQCKSAVIARMEKLEAERQAVTTAAAPAKASASTSSETGKRVDASVQVTSDSQASESSTKTITATTTDKNPTFPNPVATKESMPTADGSIQPQAAREDGRFDGDKPATDGGPALESSKNVVAAAATDTNGTTVPKPSAEAKEAAMPKATKKPQTTTAKGTTSLKLPRASATQTGVAKKKATAAPSKKRQAASAAAKAQKSASTVKTAAAAAKTQKSASTVKTAKRPQPSAAQAQESVKKPRKASPPQRKSAAAPAAPPARQQRKSPSPAAAAGPIMPPTKQSLEEQPRSYKKQRVAKYFPDGKLYFGYVKYYNAEDDLWRIVYDDNDKEDYDAIDMIKYGKEYEMHKHEDPKRKKRR